MTFISEFDPVSKTDIRFDFESSDFIMLEKGDELSKIAAKRAINQIIEDANDKPD